MSSLLSPFNRVHTHTHTQVKEASKVYGVTTLEHPAVQMISMERGKFYLGGKLTVCEQKGGKLTACTEQKGP